MINPLTSTEEPTQRSVIQLTEQLDCPQSGPSNRPKNQPAKKTKGNSWYVPLIFHALATGLVVLLWYIHWLLPVTAAAFGVAVLKFGLIMWQKDGYCQTEIQYVALLETSASLLFLAIASLSLLPLYLK